MKGSAATSASKVSALARKKTLSSYAATQTRRTNPRGEGAHLREPLLSVALGLFLGGAARRPRARSTGFGQTAVQLLAGRMRRGPAGVHHVARRLSSFVHRLAGSLQAFLDPRLAALVALADQLPELVRLLACPIPQDRKSTPLNS